MEFAHEPPRVLAVHPRILWRWRCDYNSAGYYNNSAGYDNNQCCQVRTLAFLALVS